MLALLPFLCLPSLMTPLAPLACFTSSSVASHSCSFCPAVPASQDGFPPRPAAASPRVWLKSNLWNGCIDSAAGLGAWSSVGLPVVNFAFERRRRIRSVGRKRESVVALTGESMVLVPYSPSSTNNNKPRRIALFVEPSPFAYVSGYKNRFLNFIKYLREMGDEVMVVTTHKGAPDEFCGAKVIASWSFPCPWYTLVPLSLALSPRIIWETAKFKPDIIHASSPGVMVVGALIIAKLLSVPLVLSYHTHVPLYIPKYTFSWLVKPMWLIIKFLHRAADLTLVTSNVVGRELQAAGAAAAYKIRLWRKGVDSQSFNPSFRSHEMRARLSGGEVDRPLIIHVGRLGAEKNPYFLTKVLKKIPEARLAFIGDGPIRQELEKMFEGLPVVFTGMLQGEELSQAYASGDIFVTPSESETLGFVILEAMASGVPIVAARAGGVPDIISPSQEGETGFLYTPGDIDDCVGKIVSLISSSELRQKIGAAGRAEVEKHDWQAATRHVRNDEYNAAIWFWQRRKRQLSRWFMWLLGQNPVKLPCKANWDSDFTTRHCSLLA